MDELQNTVPATDNAEAVQPSQEIQPESTGVSETAAEESEQDRAARLVKEDKVRRERAQRNQRAYIERIARERDEFKQALLEQVRQPQAPAAPPPATGEPTRDQFADYEDFVAAKAEYRAVQRLNKQVADALQAHQAQIARQSEQQVDAAHYERVAKASERFADFSDVVDRDDVIVPEPAAAAIKRQPDSDAIVYAIGKNPAIAQHLAKLDPVSQIAYIGRLSASLSQSPQPSKAPAPGKPVGGGGGAGSDLASMTRDQYYASITKHHRKG